MTISEKPLAREGAGYRLVSYSVGNSPVRAGVLVNGRIYDAAGAIGHQPGAPAAVSVRDLLGHWSAADEALSDYARKAVSGAIPGLDLAAATLHSPVLFPGTIFCAGANYRDHLEEMFRARNLPPPPVQDDDAPWHFLRPPQSCVRGPSARVNRPAGSTQFDWEVELAVVIGKPARNVGVGDALQYVAGYMVANDLSARDLARRMNKAADSPFHFDWTAHKGFDGACPMGPWMTPARDIKDPQSLGMRLWVNGAIKQDSSTAQMIFSTAEQIAHLSRRLTLNPGDVILTGTPAGVGMARKEFLQPGDTVRVEIEGLGEIETYID